MRYLNAETVCAMTGVHPSTLKSWKRAGLISSPESHSLGYSWAQYIRINHILLLTARGDTLREVYNLIYFPLRYQHSGWTIRQEEIIALLCDRLELTLFKTLRQMSTDYDSEHFVTCLLMPLNALLQNDDRPGSEERRTLFHRMVVQQAMRVMQASERQKAIPIFLEAVSMNNETEVWMECIRLTGLGFRVELSALATGIPASPWRRHEHHMMWCGAGISESMNNAFLQRLGNGAPVMLCGPDKMVRPA